MSMEIYRALRYKMIDYVGIAHFFKNSIQCPDYNPPLKLDPFSSIMNTIIVFIQAEIG